MRLLSTFVVIAAVALVLALRADAHLVTRPADLTSRASIHRSQTINLAHARYVCRRGARAHKRWACHAAHGWLLREWRETLPPPPAPVWRGAASITDPCQRELVGRETVGTYDPGIWNYSGSKAFGLPQALPYSKMPRAAWPREYGGREDPWVQLAWQRGYVRRYGGMCAALAFQIRNGWY